MTSIHIKDIVTKIGKFISIIQLKDGKIMKYYQHKNENEECFCRMLQNIFQLTVFLKGIILVQVYNIFKSAFKIILGYFTCIF